MTNSKKYVGIKQHHIAELVCLLFNDSVNILVLCDDVYLTNKMIVDCIYSIKKHQTITGFSSKRISTVSSNITLATYADYSNSIKGHRLHNVYMFDADSIDINELKTIHSFLSPSLRDGNITYIFNKITSLYASLQIPLADIV